MGGVAGRAPRDRTQLVTWESAAELQLEHITGVWTNEIRDAGIKWCHTQIGWQIDWLITNYFNEPVATMDELENAWRYIGVYALSAWREFTDATLTGLTSWTLQQLAEKQAAYGQGNILKFGARGLIVRMSDKRERLENMWRTGHKSMIEPIEDTYMDLLGYSAIGLMLLDGTFTLPLEKDIR